LNLGSRILNQRRVREGKGGGGDRKKGGGLESITYPEPSLCYWVGTSNGTHWEHIRGEVEEGGKTERKRSKRKEGSVVKICLIVYE